MHSGVPPGIADSTASALRAMRGRSPAPAADPEAPPAAAKADWPPLLVIHGSLDRVVSATNAAAAARLWAAAAGVVDETVRSVQRGARYPMTVTDFGLRNRPAATLCEIEGLGHAWSGGPATERFSDPRGPDASRLVWAFMSRRFRAAQPRPRALKRSG
jgi:poly(3-hydroxybutyrate) depolymerase